jgi:hypothetical protein
MQENLETLRQTYNIASRLTLIPGFPNRDEAIRAVSDWLIKQCPDLECAEWLIRSATTERYDDAPWQGVRELETRYNAKYNPALPAFEAVKRRCPRCWDTGIVNYADTPAEWCSCPMGANMRIADPEAVDKLNVKPVRPSAAIRIAQIKTAAIRIAEINTSIDLEVEEIKRIQRENQAKNGRALDAGGDA